MVEPRKPRVIRTRPGTPKPPGAGALEPAVPGAVRATSSKVTLVPVDPADAADTASTAKPAKPAKPVSTAKPAKPAKPERKGAPHQDTPPAKDGNGAAKGPLWRRITRKRNTTQAQNAEGGSGLQVSGGAQVLAFPVPEYKRKRRLAGWTALVTVVVLAAVMAVALFSPVLAVKTVVFEGNSLVAVKTLESALEPLRGKPLPQITDAQVRDLLASVVQIKGTQIQARPPSTLVVQLVERVPVALLKNGQEYVLVDQDGVQLGATADPEAAALPLIDGGKAVIGQDTFQAMTAVLANLPQSILKQLANASASSPDAVELKLTDGRTIIWGSASDMDLKAQVLQALLDAPLPVPAAGKPAPVPAKVFDVSAPRHPVTR